MLYMDRRFADYLTTLHQLQRLFSLECNELLRSVNLNALWRERSWYIQNCYQVSRARLGKTKQDSGQLVSRPRFEPSTSQIQLRSVTASANLLRLNKDQEFKFKSNNDTILCIEQPDMEMQEAPSTSLSPGI